MSIPKGYKGFKQAPTTPDSKTDKPTPKGYKRVKQGSFWVMKKIEEIKEMDLGPKFREQERKRKEEFRKRWATMTPKEKQAHYNDQKVATKEPDVSRMSKKRFSDFDKRHEMVESRTESIVLKPAKSDQEIANRINKLEKAGELGEGNISRKFHKVMTWSNKDKGSPKDMEARVRKMTDKELLDLQGTAADAKAGSGSARSAQIKMISREIRRRGIKSESKEETNVENIQEEVAGWIAFYNRQKLEIKKGSGAGEADSLYKAKLVAIDHWKVPKTKQSLVAIKAAYNEDYDDQTEETITENHYVVYDTETNKLIKRFKDRNAAKKMADKKPNAKVADSGWFEDQMKLKKEDLDYDDQAEETITESHYVVYNKKTKELIRKVKSYGKAKKLADSNADYEISDSGRFDSQYGKESNMKKEDLDGDALITEGKIDPVRAREFLLKAKARRKDFFTLNHDQISQLLDFAKEMKYRKSKNAPGSTARMFHSHLENLANKADKMAQQQRESLELDEKKAPKATAQYGPDDDSRDDFTVEPDAEQDWIDNNHELEIKDRPDKDKQAVTTKKAKHNKSPVKESTELNEVKKYWILVDIGKKKDSGIENEIMGTATTEEDIKSMLARAKLGKPHFTAAITSKDNLRIRSTTKKQIIGDALKESISPLMAATLAHMKDNEY